MATPPVLYLIFNRPDLVARSFESIRAARPRELFIAADGPRATRPGEAELCAEARAIVDSVDWDCEVKTLFRDANLGCRTAVSSAIAWFFEQVEEGIVLEDDCVADASFFPFCQELLLRYRDDQRVMCITGDNFQDGAVRGEADYYFSIYNHCWGWASWRRAWRHYDLPISQWPKVKAQNLLAGFLRDDALRYWSEIFDRVYNAEIDTWDYPWTYSCWMQGGLTATPNVNLVTNIGFDARATHTVSADGASGGLARGSLSMPLTHPTSVVRSSEGDHYTEDHHHGLRRTRSARRVRRALRRLSPWYLQQRWGAANA